VTDSWGAAAGGALPRLTNALRELPSSYLAGVERMVVAAAGDVRDRGGYDAVVVVVGPQRWHPTYRAELVAGVRGLAGSVGVRVDVYPVRPTDVTSYGALRNATVMNWLDTGESVEIIRSTR
jgi:hypothetical protein